jgi:hypothetical protein
MPAQSAVRLESVGCSCNVYTFNSSIFELVDLWNLTGVEAKVIIYPWIVLETDVVNRSCLNVTKYSVSSSPTLHCYEACCSKAGNLLLWK